MAFVNKLTIARIGKMKINSKTRMIACPTAKTPLTRLAPTDVLLELSAAATNAIANEIDRIANRNFILNYFRR